MVQGDTQRSWMSKVSEKSAGATLRIEGKPAQAAGRRHASTPATPERLEAAALRYLERYSASSAHLEKLLLHKVRRSEILHGTDAVAGAMMVRSLIERLQASGILNDDRYAEGKATSLRRRGGSVRSIRAALAARGIAGDLAQRAIQSADEESGVEGTRSRCRAAIGAAQAPRAVASETPWRVSDEGHRRARPRRI